ncbi:MAG TPA: response regulator [Bryobacteraceae bacterium]|nr:response regulator [Bryobacteraceae bacterium]
MATGSLTPMNSVTSLLVVSSDELDHHSLHRILEDNCSLHGASSRLQALSVLRQYRPRVVICDQRLSDGDWRDLLNDLQHQPGGPPLIVSSRLADDRLWAEVLNLGGYDLLTKPFVPSEVNRVVTMAAQRGV